MCTISMLYFCIQYVVGAPRAGKCCCATERVFLNCTYNSIWAHCQCTWEEDRLRTQHIPGAASKEGFSMDCHLCISFVGSSTTTFPISCAWICSGTLDPLTGHREAKNPSVYIQSSERSLEGWKVNFACWPTGLEAALLASCWRAASWPHRLWQGDQRAQSSSQPWIDSAAFGTSKPLWHSRGAPSPLKLYPFHANFYK